MFESLIFYLVMSAAGLYFALSSTKYSGRNEILRLIRNYVRGGGWMIGVGSLLVVVRVILVMFGVMSK